MFDGPRDTQGQTLQDIPPQIPRGMSCKPQGKPHLLVSPVEREGMAREVDNILPQVELLVHVTHGGLLGIDALKSSGIVLVEVGHVHEEFPEAAFLEQAHQA